MGLAVNPKMMELGSRWVPLFFFRCLKSEHPGFLGFSKFLNFPSKPFQLQQERVQPVVGSKIHNIIPQIVPDRSNPWLDLASHTDFPGQSEGAGSSLNTKALCKPETNCVSLPPHSTRYGQSSRMKLLCGQGPSCAKIGPGWDPTLSTARAPGYSKISGSKPV